MTEAQAGHAAPGQGIGMAAAADVDRSDIGGLDRAGGASPRCTLGHPGPAAGTPAVVIVVSAVREVAADNAT